MQIPLRLPQTPGEGTSAHTSDRWLWQDLHSWPCGSTGAVWPARLHGRPARPSVCVCSIPPAVNGLLGMMALLRYRGHHRHMGRRPCWPHRRSRGAHRDSRSPARHMSTAALAAAVASEPLTEADQLGGIGILGSISDLPRTKALGIEIRASAALAAPVCMLDGSFLEEPHRVRHELGGDVDANKSALCKTLRELVDHFKWKGVVGCSVTKKVSTALGIVSDDFSTVGKEMGAVLARFLRGKVSFCHTVVHTDAAGYNELVWGVSAQEVRWRGQVVLVCTLGNHIGAAMFNNGRRVRNAPLPMKTIESLPGFVLDGKFTPPAPGSADFDTWADLVDLNLCELVQGVSTLDRVIAVPTGRTARSDELSEALLPKLFRTREAAGQKSCKVTVQMQQEGSVVRGVALCGLVELQTAQITQSLESVLHGDQALHSLSGPQLRVIYDKLDVNCRGGVLLGELQEGLQVLGIQHDTETLFSEFGTARDGIVSFDGFVSWWRKEVEAANIVRITSASAWKSIIAKDNVSNFGELILLEVTFTFCRSCRRFEPKLRRLSEQYPQVRFVQLVGNGTIGAMELSTKELEVSSSPAFFIFRRGGELLARWTGADLERFQAHISECLGVQEQRAGPTAGTS